MRIFAAAIIVGCTLCTVCHPQEKSKSDADRLLEKCIKTLKYGQINEFEKPAKQDAVVALGMLADDRAVPILLEYLHNEKDEHLQFQIIRALGWIKSAKAIPALEKLLQHKDRIRRDAAMFALETITGKDYGAQEQLRRSTEKNLLDLLPDLEGSGLGGRKGSPGCPELEVGKTYRFVFARVPATVALVAERPREGWAKVRLGEGQAVSWVNLSGVVMIVPVTAKK